MRKQRTTVLAGIAALALIAGTGFVAAQDAAKEQKGAVQPHAATQPTQSEKGSPAKMGQTAQPAPEQKTEKGKVGQSESTPKGAAENTNADRMKRSTSETGAGTPAMEPNRHAQDVNRDGKANKERMGEGKGRMDEDRAQGERGKPGAPTTAEQGRPGGPNAGGPNAGAPNAAQARVTLNEEQRTRIRDTVINARGAPRVGHVNFGVNVGTVIPRGGVEIVPVPETLVLIEPRWRGFSYFIYESELVIVDPRDMTIVAVVPV
jgi:hypothetical protein